MSESKSGRPILLVDDEEDLREVLADLLKTSGYSISTAVDGRDALQKLDSARPDLVILDLMLPDESGFEICKKIKARSPGYLPVILLTARGDLDSMVDGLVEAAADDYVVKPFRHRELLARIGACLRVKDLHDVVRRQNDLLSDLSITDDLTGLYNRRYLTRKLNERIESLRMNRGALSCALIDLDNFKQVNDTAGHLVGDEVLRKFGRMLLKSVGPEDLCGRWGGDEFLILFDSQAETAIRGWAQQIIGKVEQELPNLIGDRTASAATRPRLSLSGGAATVTGPDPTLDTVQLIADLDSLLYQAKQGGRSKINVAQPNAAGRAAHRMAPPKPPERPTVFVLEDDPDICSVIRDMLSRQNVETVVFQETRKMMDELKIRVPDLILLDLRLSDGDGMEVCRTLRKNPSLARTRISFLTAFTSEDVRQKAMACGADDFLLKPFTYSKFVEKVNRLLGLSS